VIDTSTMTPAETAALISDAVAEREIDEDRVREIRQPAAGRQVEQAEQSFAEPDADRGEEVEEVEDERRVWSAREGDHE
jgi:hypothetical protein